MKYAPRKGYIKKNGGSEDIFAGLIDRFADMAVRAIKKRLTETAAGLTEGKTALA